MKRYAMMANVALSLLFHVDQAMAGNPIERDIIMPVKECSAILAGMANDARVDETVSVEYDGVNLSLEGRGRSYSAWCKNGRIFFSGSYEVVAQ